MLFWNTCPNLCIALYCILLYCVVLNCIVNLLLCGYNTIQCYAQIGQSIGQPSILAAYVKQIVKTTEHFSLSLETHLPQKIFEFIKRSH